MLSDVVDGGDVGMIERARRLGFLLEAPQTIRIRREGGEQHLDRDVALQPLIPRPVHLPHPARADGREDLVGAEAGTRREAHGLRPNRRDQNVGLRHDSSFSTRYSVVRYCWHE